MKVHLSDGSFEEVEGTNSLKELAIKLRLTSPHQALAVKINGVLCDLSSPLNDGDRLEWVHFDSPEGTSLFWHSTAHILAQAVLRLYPDAKPTIGPSIENGFYYDFANLHISDEDLSKIEKEMQKIVKENHRPKKVAFVSKEEASSSFETNSYKQQLIKEIPEDEILTAYEQGEFFDLCRGPHLPNLGKVKALKLLKISGAYWKGDSKNEMLTRIYGISYPEKALIKEYITRIEEAKKRDHKLIGAKLDLFSLQKEGPGMPFLHPKGMLLWNTLIDFWRATHRKAGYQEIKTPSMLSKELWETSGHWFNYRENMYTSIIEEKEFAIKPMNCPGGILHYKHTRHSYREFPLRIGEIGHVHRFEPSGAISGLFRVRSFHQDDAHIYCTKEQIEPEILSILQLVDIIYSAFGLSYHLELSTRPKKNTIGTDEDWETSTEALRQALLKSERDFKINEGDGAFYGPKIDMHIKDALGRTWQCGTIQLDMSLPNKFNLEYTNSHGERECPVMIHRAIYGSLERFMGILIEHFAGKFPLWLSPRQVRLLTVADRHIEYAHKLHSSFFSEGIESECDTSNESISKKVRLAQLDQVNYILVIGDREVEKNTATLRTRDNVIHGEVNPVEFLDSLKKEVKSRSLLSPFVK